MQTTPTLRMAALLVAGVLITTRAEAGSLEEEFLVVDDAQDIRTTHVSDTEVQITYSIEAPYPARAIGAAHWEALQSVGWSRCRPRDIGAKDTDSEWDYFVDASSAQESVVHQQVSYWLKGDRFITIVMRYRSLDTNTKRVPDNTHQKVYLIFDEKHGHEAAALFDLDCS